MKTLTIIVAVLVLGIRAHAQVADPDRKGSSAQLRHGLFGDFSIGISNYGMAGELKMYYRTGKKFFSAGYYQSHICTAGEYDGIPFWRSGGVTHHVSTQSYSAGFGYMLRRKWKQGISAGISINRITQEMTDPILNDLSVGGVYRELAGEGFEEHSHGKGHTIAVGIPVEYKVFLFNKGTIGLDMAARFDINRTMIFSAITVGLRIGK